MRLLRGTVPETSGPSQPPFHDQATPQPQRRQGQVGVLNGTQGQISCLPQPGRSLQLVSTGRLLKSSNDTLGAPSAPLDKGWPYPIKARWKSHSGQTPEERGQRPKPDEEDLNQRLREGAVHPGCVPVVGANLARGFQENRTAPATSCVSRNSAQW